jgi:ABC-type multidrug transport system ATPase subunit
MVGWVPQRAGWGYAAPTIAETVERRIHSTGVQLGADQVLVEAGLIQVGALHPLDISVGERQRLGLVLATLHKPLVWVLDEPSRGMDPVATAWLLARIRRHCADGGVVVFATHDTDLVAAVATHALWVGEQALREGITPTYARAHLSSDKTGGPL